MVLCPFHRSHREICTQNQPVSETTFLDDLGGPFLSRPLSFTAESILEDFARDFSGRWALFPVPKIRRLKTKKSAKNVRLKSGKV